MQAHTVGTDGDGSRDARHRALAAAPSASAPARTIDCDALKIKWDVALDLATLYFDVGDKSRGDYYRGQFFAFYETWMECCLGR